ncbi:hypothetical protein [Rhodovulum sulfidophilum]|uniref:hypothetical protein n=1 Tax=Rhodovulum sulfidophilum TaxID=35806 RepID=UPI001F2E7807|nr:hypothetical protein [Rhodovulum sulfidophilum]MCE8438386.1 hypothetical protein [Rhodovulum sulfidophilum]MCE8468324.1 hypothetical protein [Rhodovulum sulfidophilum]
MQNLPGNWRFATTASDFRQPAELIPGDDRYVFGVEVWFSRQKRDGRRKDVFHYIFGLIVIPVFFGPAMLWRWAIKSTAWFYLPLLWSRRGWRRLEGEELRIWANAYSSKILNWVWLIFGGLSFAAVAGTLFSLQKYLSLKDRLSAEGAPFTVLGFLSSLDWADLLHQPWLWFYIPSYALTIIIFFALDNIAKDIRVGADPASRMTHMERWMWASNLRSVLTNIGLGIALWYFLDAVDAWGKAKTFAANLLAV